MIQESVYQLHAIDAAIKDGGDQSGINSILSCSRMSVESDHIGCIHSTTMQRRLLLMPSDLAISADELNQVDNETQSMVI